MDRAFLNTEDVLRQALGDIAGLRVADIGAGSGRFTRQLVSLGAQAVGIEPNPEAVAAAESAGVGRFVQAPAEATGEATDSYDITLFSFSLHHVGDMDAGLREACRITRPGGRLAVIEPEVPDPLYPIMRFIDDESAVYEAAQAALGRAAADGAVEHRLTQRFASRQRVETPAQMIEALQAIDASRRLAESDRGDFEAAFAAALQCDEAGGFIPYWSRIDVFASVR